MFDVGFGELTALALIALFVFGPDRLPQVAAQAGRMLRELRGMAAGARRELGEHIDPELASLDVKSLDPRRIVRDAVLDPDGTSRRNKRPAGEAPPPFDPDTT